MEKQPNLYVLAKKEVALIFVFMVLVAITSFAFGVKVGKNYSFRVSGLQQQDRQLVESMLSRKEEKMQEVVIEKKDNPDKNDKAVQDTYDKLKKEFDKLEEEAAAPVAKLVAKPMVDEASPEPDNRSAKANDQYAGKFTVQLGSHQSMEDAEKFANGFRVRGYNPVINEVEIENRGAWFRVSLGVFDTIEDTKVFIIKEKSLFQGMDYVIGRFD